jgi:tetratricopeptide (TPR) repeat protein
LELGDTYTQPQDQSKAMDCYTKAKAMLPAPSAETQNTQARSDLASLLLSLATWERNYGSLSTALNDARQSVTIRSELLALNPSNCIARRDLAQAYAELGAIDEKLNSQQAAEESYQKSLSLWQEMEQKRTLAGAYLDKPSQLSAKLAKLQQR